MGFLDKAKENLDKAKENLEKVAKQGQDKIDEVQSKKKADGLLRDLGAWTYATHTGRDGGKGPSEVQRITAQLEAHEAEHGPLGGDKSDDPSEGTAAAPGPEARAVPTGGAAAPAGIVPPPPPASAQGTPADPTPAPGPMSGQGVPGAATPPPPAPPATSVTPPAAEPAVPDGGFTLDDL